MPGELTSMITTIEFLESMLKKKCQEKEKRYKDCVKNKKYYNIDDCIPYFKEFNKCQRTLNDFKK